MNREDDNIEEKPIHVNNEGDTPTNNGDILDDVVITIERDDDDEPIRPQRSKRSTWLRRIAMTVGILAFLATCYGGLKVYNYYYNYGVALGVSPTENIEKLERTTQQTGSSQITLTTETIHDVDLNIYHLQNVKAEISLTEPTPDDKDVLMFTRSSDYKEKGEYIGSLVIDGEEIQSDVSRLGYCGIANGNMVIGISRFEDVKDYTIDHHGSFFRQFVLVSDGELPRRFHLHGKVERNALARTDDDKYHFIKTCHPETLRDFANALREYGYIDAIYITGGNESGFYRDTTGKVSYFNQKHIDRPAPWLIFKKK